MNGGTNGKMLFDAHTHLNFERFTEEERRLLASEIEASDLGYIIDVADCVSSARQAIRDSEEYSWCYAAAGIHPDHAMMYSDEDIAEIRRLAENPKVVAIGETGLDFYYGKDDRQQQEELFRKQIRLAVETELPLMIHTRDADRLTMDILKDEGAFSERRLRCFPGRPAPGTLAPEGSGNDLKLARLTAADGRSSFTELVPDARVQLHCFSGSAELAEEYVRLGATISLGGPVTFRNGRRAAEVAARIPIEMLLCETDAPYMAPEPLRGRPNKPYYVEHVVRRIALLKGLTYEKTADILTANGRRFFGISD